MMCPVKLIQKLGLETGCQWLTTVILATQEAEIRQIDVQSQPRQIVLRDPISKTKQKKKAYHKKGLAEWLKV
jgi:hypothetical protein